LVFYNNEVMKKITVVGFFICSLLLANLVQAQTAAEIISRHIAAMGGAEKIMSLSSAVMNGTFAPPGAAPINITATKKHVVGSRIDIEANGTNNYQIITPTNGWIYTPVQGDTEPRPLNENQFKVGQVQLDLHGPFINSAQKGYKIELAGKDTVDGSMCYKLQVTAANANVTVYSIDSKSNFIVKTSTKMFQFGKMEDVVTLYMDYKQNEDGYWFAYSNVAPRGTTHYDKIIANVAVDEKMFKIK
jgi:hypothetical protein